MAYFKSYTTRTSSSYLGRDDGYPMTAIEKYDSLELMAETLGAAPDERFYDATEIAIDAIQKVCSDVFNAQQAREAAETRAKKMQLLQALKKELGEA